MDETRRLGVKVDGKFILQLESYRQKMRRAIVQRETGAGCESFSPKMWSVLTDPEFDIKWGRFVGRFDLYLKKTRVEDDGGNNRDPWKEVYQKFVEEKHLLREKRKGSSGGSGGQNFDHDRYFGDQL